MTDEETLRFLNGENWIDSDLVASSLTHSERAALQVYRNYTRSFEDQAITLFQSELVGKDWDLIGLDRLCDLLVCEDLRFTPIIVCGFADDLLIKLFKEVLPDEVPGGKSDMLSGYGPLSDLSKRIRMAFAFDLLSSDLMRALDTLRKLRNRISHDWNLKSTEQALNELISAELHPIETALKDIQRKFPSDSPPMKDEHKVRVRLIWLSGRLNYEALIYNKAKTLRLSPNRALYGGEGTSLLQKISAICMTKTRDLLN
jgi:hypothetical protein